MDREVTERGFGRYEFKDRYGMSCSIQDSSLATENCIWLGADEPDLARMHLTQEMAAELIPLLQYFVKHGELP